MATTPENWCQLPEQARELIKQGKGDAELALSLGITTSEARVLRNNVKKEAREVLAKRVKQLKDAGYSNSEIVQEINLSESSVRRLLAP